MNITRHDPAKAEADHSEIFIGDARRQPLLPDGVAKLLRVNSVTFKDGARNKLHDHAADQVLVVTHGFGIIANENTEHPVEAGDIVFIPAGERHWHGARPGQEMTHLSILTPGQLTIHET